MIETAPTDRALDVARWQLCEHEAAHCVVAIEVGVEQVTAVRLGPSCKGGKTWLAPNWSWLDAEEGKVPAEVLRARIVTLWAGPIIACEQKRPEGAKGDITKMIQCGAFTDYDPQALFPVTAGLLEREHVRRRLGAVARGLYLRDTLDSADIQTLIEEEDA